MVVKSPSRGPESIPVASPATAQQAVSGLYYFSEVISALKEKELADAIDASEWLQAQGKMIRRVQHYGWIYDYRARKIDPDMYLGPLPGWLDETVALLNGLNGPDGLPLHPTSPDQCIINEYRYDGDRKDGIGAHIDCPPCFGPVIASLSLLSGCLMNFSRPDGSDKIALWLAPRSLLVLTGEARTDWMHEIVGRKSDTIGDMTIPRGRRLSATFRTVLCPIESICDESECLI